MVKSSQYSQPLDQRQVEFESDFLVIQDLVKAYPQSEAAGAAKERIARLR